MLAQVIGHDKYAVLMPREHRLMRKKTITWQDIAATRPILLKPPSLIRTYLDQHLARLGISLTPAYEVALPWTMTGMVRAGVGVAIVTTGVLPVAERMGLELRTVSAPVIERELAVLTRAGLVTTRRIGQWVFYQRDEAAILALLPKTAASV